MKPLAHATIGMLLPFFFGTTTASDIRPVSIAPTTQQEIAVDAAIHYLIDCESGGRNIKIVDSNGYYSYGILQYQKSTWADFSQKSGITGDPMNESDAIRMARWAVPNHQGPRWSCWKSVPKDIKAVLP